MKEKITKFMQGRYGLDEFSKFLNKLVLGLLIVSILVRGNDIFFYIAAVIMVYMYYRTYSKNYQKRYGENQKYLEYARKWGFHYEKMKRQWKERKDYHIYKCPSCSQKIRIPRGKGKIEIRCPKCNERFIKKS